MSKGNATIKDIAVLAGVSYSTVSRSLNGSPSVSKPTKDKIAKIADDLGFEFNANARGLITQKSGTIGIVLPENYTEISVNVYHGMLMNDLRSSLEKADVDLIVTYQKNHYNTENNVIRLVNRKKVDGLIMLVETLDDETLTFLRKRQFPFICTHYPPAQNLMAEDVIYTDHISGGRQAARHLISVGRRRLVKLAADGDHLEFKMREMGFRSVVEKEGLDFYRLESKTAVDSAYRAVLANFDKISDCDGLFASNDLMAIGAIRAFREKGRLVPEDISVVGYDDSEYAQYFLPSITTIHQPREELAVLACNRLFSQMEKREADEEIISNHISIRPNLVVRETS